MMHDGMVAANGQGGPLWIGAVLSNDLEERRKERGEFPQSANTPYGGSSTRSDLTPQNTELSAAISFAKEIRELRTRPPSSEGIPPLDIAAALGAHGQGEDDRHRSRGARPRGAGPS